MNLPEMGILFHADCPFQLESLTASDHAVWGIRSGAGTLVVRVGLEKCPMGYDWVEDCLAGPRRFVSVALFGKSGWALDPNGVLWFNNCVQEMSPFGVGDWFQVRGWGNVDDYGEVSYFMSSLLGWPFAGTSPKSFID